MLQTMLENLVETSDDVTYNQTCAHFPQSALQYLNFILVA